MNVKGIGIHNFLGIGNGMVTFDKAGVVLVEGVNHDSPTSVSNGSGKSSLFEALFWCLFGKTKRGLTGDDVINTFAGKDCLVAVCFDDYRVTRTRKHSTYGTTLILEQEFGSGMRDLTKGTVKETQALLESVIKMSELTFSKVAYFGQGDVKGFAELSDAELKNVFEQALGLEFFTEYLNKVKVHRAGLESDCAVRESKMWAAISEWDSAADLATNTEIAIEDFRDNALRMKKHYEDEMDKIMGEREEYVATGQAMLDDIKAKLDKLDAVKEKYEKLKALQGALDEKLSAKALEDMGARSKYGTVTDKISAERANIESIGKKIGTRCGECGKVYQAADLASAKIAADKRLETLESELKALTPTVAVAAKDVEKLVALSSGLKEKILAMAGEMGAVAALESEHERLSKSFEAGQKRLAERYVEAGREAEAIRTTSPMYERRLKGALERLDTAESEIDTAQAEASRYQAELVTAKALEQILGNGGLKSYVFDSITPELNRLIDKKIKVLDDIDIELSTVSKLKSGELREKFEVKVMNRHGASVFAGNSGGEQQKVNLAISLAINTLMRSIAEAPINLIFLDEAFENLDDGSSEGVMELIETIDVPNVFLITHRQGVKELVTNVVTVEKSGGMALIK